MKKMRLFILSFCVMFFVFSLSVFAAAIYDHEVTFDTNGGDYIHQDISSIGDKLSTATNPVVILAEGDSTSDAAGEWFYDSMNALGSYIEDYSIQYRLWDNATSSYKTNTNLQYGSEGDAYGLLPDAAQSYFSTLDSTDLSIVGDLDLRAKVRVDAGELATIISKWGAVGNYSFYMGYFPSGDGSTSSIGLYWSEDGTAIKSASSGAFATVNGADIWIRATLDVDDGGGNKIATFYKSADGVTWTSILAVTTATATSIFDSSANIEIGTRTNGTVGFFSGRIYAAEIRDGIAGKIAASPELDMAFPSTISSFKDTEGNIWNLHGDVTVGNGSPGLLVMNGSMSGSVTSTYINYIK